MNRISRELPAGLRGFHPGSHQRRGRSINGDPVDRDESLDLFARTRHSQTVASSAESDGLMKLGMISVGSTRPLRSGMDDLLSSTEGGKHDYDWLLTPPETPLFSSLDANELHQSLATGRNSAVRSASINKPSRLSVSQSDNGPAKPVRSNSVTRSSVSNIHSSYSSNTNRTSVLNTSTASVSSSRPSTPTSRSSTVRSSPSTARPIAGRSSTPAKTRPSSIASTDKPRASAISSSDKSRPSQNPRPSTPTSRPQMPANLNPTASRSTSRPSTPTRRTPVPASTSVPARSSSVGRVPSTRNTAPSSRASSPSPRSRPLPQPIVPPDFPLDAPPNLRTTLPDRPVSAGRSRPGAAVTMRTSLEAAGPTNAPRRHSSPIVSRSRLPEVSRRSQHSNGHGAGVTEMNKGIPSRSSKPTSSTDSTGFGRTISKKSLDMALRHMDIRQNMGSIRGLSGNSLFPQSIRSSNPKGRLGRVSDSPSSVGSNGSENGNGSVRSPDPVHEAHGDNGRVMAKLSLESDIYESSRYDSLLLKEDLKNTNWLHSVEDKSDQSPIFDHRFELLPEPFSLI
ncbi:hypothetical protein H6P81_014592 [Aristolochia fimbriata]|uniref:Uncharacterized protein n=1 Tax=Aristolochia fimbriata TaxID=158543 RepID=A0AAV7E605_ARIFI|nr:hypothetical protein H6P81_014592 [Aristolochia fimbriata]